MSADGTDMYHHTCLVVSFQKEAKYFLSKTQQKRDIHLTIGE
jgi:hypothetical protein